MKTISKVVADGKTIGNKIGTVVQETSMEVELFVPRHHGAYEAALWIKEDTWDGWMRKDMQWRRLEDDFDVFVCAMDTANIGIYWYYFSIDSYCGYQVSYRVGPSMDFSTDTNWMSSLQLTVYRREYAVPEFLAGGLFYHIYVDRFFAGEETDWRNDEIKQRYHLRRLGEPYDNLSERSIIKRKDWGNTPVWEPDARGDVLNNDFFGGNLDGIRQKLPYLASLGVTCLYLSPIFEAYSNHKYDTGDYNKIDAMFGDEAIFSDLCKQAKTYGISIILDGVFNHTGSDSRYFDQYHTYATDGAYESKLSPYREWFDFRDDGVWRSWWGITTLPTVNKDAKGFQNLLFSKDGIIRKWIRLGAAGWRLDVVDELPDDFVEELVKAAKAERADAVVLGEVWEDASNKVAYSARRRYFWGRELDSVMNYPWKDAILRFVRESDGMYLAQKIDEICTHYPPEVLRCLMNPLGTHDSVRVMTALAGPATEHMSRQEKSHVVLTGNDYECGVARLKLASLLQMTLPGVPCIYYGDEAGMQGANDPFNRGCYPWGSERKDLVSWYRTLGQLRKEHRKLFAEGDCRILSYGVGRIAYARTFGKEALLCAENVSDAPWSLPWGGEWINLLSTEKVDSPLILSENGGYVLMLGSTEQFED